MDNALISEVSGVARPIINKLLGKSKNIMSTIVEGTNNLSTQIRTNEYWDALMVKKSDEMKTAYDDWVTGGKVGAAPRPPMFAITIQVKLENILVEVVMIGK